MKEIERRKPCGLRGKSYQDLASTWLIWSEVASLQCQAVGMMCGAMAWEVGISHRTPPKLWISFPQVCETQDGIPSLLQEENRFWSDSYWGVLGLCCSFMQVYGAMKHSGWWMSCFPYPVSFLFKCLLAWVRCYKPWIKILTIAWLLHPPNHLLHLVSISL